MGGREGMGGGNNNNERGRVLMVKNDREGRGRG
jgi:hypothetical protein